MKDDTRNAEIKIISVRDDLLQKVIRFSTDIFHVEQEIPRELIPLKYDHQQWWCILHNSPAGGQIIGSVAAWKNENEWHWGRFAVHPDFRGLGLGKKLATLSFNNLFQSPKTDVDLINIDARKITVNLILKLGGVVVGDQIDFYGLVTPMALTRGTYLAVK